MIEADSFKGIHKKPSTYIIGLLVILSGNLILFLFQEQSISNFEKLSLTKQIYEERQLLNDEIVALQQKSLIDSIKQFYQVEFANQKRYYQNKSYQVDLKNDIENDIRNLKQQLLVDYGDIDLNYPFNSMIDSLDMNRVKVKMNLWHELKVTLKKSDQLDIYQNLVDHIYKPRFRRISSSKVQTTSNN